MSDNIQFDDVYKLLFFGIAVYAVCLIIRRGAELLFPVLKSDTSKAGKIWMEFILPALPVLLGLVAGVLIKTFPYPEGLTSRVMHGAYGLVAGFGAGFAYRILKATVEKRWEVKLPVEPDDKIGMFTTAKLTPEQLILMQQRVGEALLKTKPPEE